jgi:protein CpxP
MSRSFRQTVIATTAIIGIGSIAATAAPLSAGEPTAIRPSTQSETQGQPPNTRHNMAAKIEQRITDLHVRLLISPAQQPQWDQFVQVMRDNARSMDEAFQQRIQVIPTMTATANMQSYAQIARDHAQDVQRLVPVFQALYDTMSDTQKRATDQVFRDDKRHRDHASRS